MPRRHQPWRQFPFIFALQDLHIDFIQKGLDLAFPQLQQHEAGSGAGPPDGSNRRLLHSAVERWLKPRAAAVKRLVLS